MENPIKKEIKFVAVYARVSTSNQEDQKTIEAQLSEVHKFAKERDYIIVREYKDEGWSGDILARPELDQLRHDARNREWDAVLVYDPDRLGRQLFYQQIVIEELKQLDIEVLFVTMPPVKNASDELMFGVRGLFAAYEKAKITERFRIGKVNRVKNNQILTTEAPYGYTYILNKGKRGSLEYVPGHYVINEYEAGVVKNLFKWVADERMTLRAIVKRLKELKIPPRKSRRDVWNTSTLSSLLKNETYYGLAHWGASYATVPLNPYNKDVYRKVKKTSRRMNPKDKWMWIDSVPSIIDKELFDRTQVQLKQNFELMGRNKKNNYLLAGMVFCTCGQRRAGEGPQHGKHLYYRCNDRVNSFPLLRKCHEKGVNARIADNIVWQRIKNILSSPELLQKQIERRLARQNKNIAPTSTTDIESAQKEIDRLQSQEDRYAKAYAQEIINLEKFEEYVGPIRESVGKIKNQILAANLEKSAKNEILLPNEDEISVFAQEIGQALENDSLNFKFKQILMRRVIDRVVANQKSLSVNGTINLEKINVFFRSEYRHSRSAECGEINVV